MGDVYRFRTFTLDPARRAVMRDGLPITVTPKAFDILLYLVEHPNRVVSKQDIMKAVWPDTIVEEANLAVNLSLLRKALGDRDDDRLIVTVARQGYQFAANVTAEPFPTASPATGAVAPRRARWALGAGLLLVTVTLAWSQFHREPADSLRLAVLPIDNLTGDSTRNYLADGLTDELITHLARLDPARLGVIARSSVMQYKRGDTRLDQLGRDLAVQYVIESSLQQSANRLRVSVRLVRLRDQRDLWASDFDYASQDMFGIEDSVGAAVAAAVQLHVSPAERRRFSQTRSTDPLAADEVLRGRGLYRYTSTKPGWDAARRYFQLAIARDSGFALAWALLGAVDRYGADRGYVSADSAIPAARAAIERALALDPNLPEAWVQRGQLERLVDWDWKTAAESYRRALALDPGSTEAVADYAWIKMTLGQVDEAIVLERHAMELDPIDPSMRGSLATLEYFAGHLHEAESLILSVPSAIQDAFMNETLVYTYLVDGRVAQAARIVPQQTTPEWELQMRALVAYAEGRRQESDSALAALTAEYRAISAYQLAEAYGFRGDADSAFAWLDRAYAMRDQGLPVVMSDPLLAKLHSEPRWGPFLTKMRLPH
jgi:TolB-like protein/DNA-binding winged helix-turn-helix (wHTH) protein